jgi:hypothetical protein
MIPNGWPGGAQVGLGRRAGAPGRRTLRSGARECEALEFPTSQQQLIGRTLRDEAARLHDPHFIKVPEQVQAMNP